MSLKDQFLTAIKRRQSIHTLPDGGSLPICELTAEEYFQAVEAGGFDTERRTWQNLCGFHARIVRYGACDEQGLPLFTDDDLPTLERARGWVGEVSWLRSTADAIWALSGVRQSDYKSGDPAPDEAGAASDAGVSET